VLKDPQLLYKIAKSVVSSVSIPVSIKMRSGYEDTSLFKENLLAAQESGVKHLTLHPRTKAEGYTAKANWELIALAKSLLKIPVIGNGDIFCAKDAIKMLELTGCDGLMLGRGVLINPFLFHQIRSVFSKKPYQASFEALVRYLEFYLATMPAKMERVVKIGKLKQILSFLFQANETLLTHRKKILSSSPPTADFLFNFAIPYLKEGF
jgi:tRNA-dihydrouridine synthase C